MADVYMCKDCMHWNGIGPAKNGGWCEKNNVPTLYNDKCDDFNKEQFASLEEMIKDLEDLF